MLQLLWLAVLEVKNVGFGNQIVRLLFLKQERVNWGSFIVEGELASAYLYRVANSSVIETANLFVQASGALGLQGKKSTFLLGGGYGIAPLSFADDVDQIHARVSYSYLRKKNEYFVNLFVPIDAPAGLLANQLGVNLVLGIQGQM